MYLLNQNKFSSDQKFYISFRQLIYGLAAVLVILNISGCGKSGAPATEDNIDNKTISDAVSQLSTSSGKWIAAKRGMIRDYTPAVGTFRARQLTQIGSQVSGRVHTVIVDVGSKVKIGEEMARLDPALFEIEVAQAKALQEAAQVALQDAELNFTRMKNLFEKPSGGETPSVSRKLYDDSKVQYNAAKAKYNQATQSLKYAQRRLYETIIRAPFDGVITRRMVDPGEPVTAAPATYLLEIQDVDVLELEFSLPQAMLSKIKINYPFRFSVEGIREGEGEGKIALIFPVIDEMTRSFRCRAYIENKTMKYRPGLLARVMVVDREIDNALIVPQKSLIQTATGWQMVVRDGKGHEAIRKVTIGIITEDSAEIKGGLSEGENVFVPGDTQ
jgi:membrane fusion protein (multidrug efflux system)